MDHSVEYQIFQIVAFGFICFLILVWFLVQIRVGITWCRMIVDHIQERQYKRMVYRMELKKSKEAETMAQDAEPLDPGLEH